MVGKWAGCYTKFHSSLDLNEFFFVVQSQISVLDILFKSYFLCLFMFVSCWKLNFCVIPCIHVLLFLALFSWFLFSKSKKLEFLLYCYCHLDSIDQLSGKNIGNWWTQLNKYIFDLRAFSKNYHRSAKYFKICTLFKLSVGYSLSTV